MYYRSCLKGLEMFSSDELCGGKLPQMIAHTCTLSKKPGSFAQGLSPPPPICLHRTADPVASCTLAILVYTLLWIVELRRPCVCAHTYTHSFFHTDSISWQPLPNPDVVYIAVNTDFYGFWFALLTHTHTHPCFGLGMMSAELPLPPGVYLGTHFLSGEGRGKGSILSPLLCCFSLTSWQTPAQGECKHTERG